MRAAVFGVGVPKYSPLLIARPQTCFNFTKAYKKIILTKDVDKLGFAGEICFVKPGHALNNLVPNRKALFFSDPRVAKFQAQVDVSEARNPLSTVRFLTEFLVFYV